MHECLGLVWGIGRPLACFALTAEGGSELASLPHLPNALYLTAMPCSIPQAFNNWWRAELEKLGRRPVASEIEVWYRRCASSVWPCEEERPSLQETRVHAKCLRSLAAVRDYFRVYRATKRGEVRPPAVFSPAAVVVPVVPCVRQAPCLHAQGPHSVIPSLQDLNAQELVLLCLLPTESTTYMHANAEVLLSHAQHAVGTAVHDPYCVHTCRVITTKTRSMMRRCSSAVRRRQRRRQQWAPSVAARRAPASRPV